MKTNTTIIRNLIFLLLWFVSISISYSQQTISHNVNGVLIEITAPQNMQTCVGQALHVSMTNNSTGIVSDFDLNFPDAPAQISPNYTAISHPNLTVDIPSNNITVTTLQVGETFAFDIPVQANCFVPTSSNNTTIAGSLTITPEQTTSQNFSFSNISISAGFLSYVSTDDNSDNIVFTGHKGDPFVRRYNMINTSANVFNGVIHMEETVTDNISITSVEIKVNGVTVTTISAPAVDPVTHKLTENFSLTSVPSGATVEILEHVTITGCPVSSGDVKLQYGCLNNFCNPILGISIPFNVIINRGPNVPVLKWEIVTPDAENDFNTCLPSNNRTKTIRLVNRGNGRAENIKTYFQPMASGAQNLMLVSEASFSAVPSDPSVVVTQTGVSRSLADIQDNWLGGNNTITYSNCFNDPLEMLIVNKDFVINALDAGEAVEFTYTERICCIESGINTSMIHDMGWHAYNYYNDECTQNILFYGYGPATNSGFIDQSGTIGGLNQFPLSLVNNMFGCLDCGGAPNCFGNPSGNCSDATLNNPSSATDFTEQIQIKTTGIQISYFPIQLDNARIVIDIATDGRLMLAPQAHLGNGAGPGNIRVMASNGVVYTPVVQNALSPTEITDVFGTTTFVHDNFAGRRIFIDIPITDIYTQGEIDLFNYSFWQFNRSPGFNKLNQFLGSLTVLFEVSGVCSRWPDNPSSWYEKIYIQPNANCADCLIPVGDMSSPLLVNCPGCQVPGVLTSAYEVERVTVGFNDGDNNGIPDANNIPSGQTLNDNAYLQMVTDNDIFRTTTRANFWGGSSLTYGSGTGTGSLESAPGYGFRFLNNLCRLDKFTQFGSLFTIVVDAQHPISINYIRNGVPITGSPITFTSNVNNVTPGLPTLWSTNGTGDFLLQFPLDLMRQQLGDPSFNFEASDLYEVTCYYKVNGTFDLGHGNYYENMDIITRSFLSGNTNQSPIAIKDVTVTDEADPASPYGIAGGFTQLSQLSPYLNYICEAYGSGLVLADIKEDYVYGVAGATLQGNYNCSKNASGIYGVQADIRNGNRTASLTDLFPFEVRNFSRTNNFRFVIPNGYVLNPQQSSISSIFTYRKDNEFSYTKVSSSKTFDNADLVVINPSYVDANGTAGKLYEVRFDYNTTPTYNDNDSFDPYQNSISLTAGQHFTDYNEFVEQQIYVGFNPVCSSPDLVVNDYFEFTDNAALISNLISGGHTPVEGFRSNTVDFDYTTNTYSSSISTLNCTEPDCHTWYSAPYGDINLVNLQPNIFISKKNQRIPFVITVTNDVPNAFVYFTSTNAQFQFGDLYISGSTTPVTKIGGVYQLNAVPGTLNFEIETQYLCLGSNNPTGLFTIHYGYVCDGNYPTLSGQQLSFTPCKLKQATINVSLTSADMEVSYSTSPGSIPCDEIQHQLTVRALGEGNIYFDQASNTLADIRTTIPANLTYTLGSSLLTAYEANGTIMQYNGLDVQIALPNPSISGNTLVWDIQGQNILELIDMHLGRYFVLTYSTDPNCHFAGGVTTASVNALSYCLDNINRSVSPNHTITFTENCIPHSVNLTVPAFVCSAQSNSVNVSATIQNPVGNYTYTWYVNSIQQGPADQPVIDPLQPVSATLSLAAASSPATIQIVIKDGDLCVANDSKQIPIFLTPNVSAGADKEICSGQSTTLTATGASVLVWTGYAGNPITVSPGTTTTYTVTGTTTYTIAGTDATCSATDNVTVIVNPLPSVDVSVGVLGCEATGTECTTATFNVTSGTAPFTFVVRDGSGSVVYSGTQNQAQLCAVGNYTVTVTDSKGCASSTTGFTIQRQVDYRIGNTNWVCNSTNKNVCIELLAETDGSSRNIRGLDFCLKYNPSVIRLSRNTFNGLPAISPSDLGPVVMNSSSTMGNANYSVYEISVSPTETNLHVSIYYTSGAPTTAHFMGTGRVVCLPFVVQGNPVAGTCMTLEMCNIIDVVSGQPRYELDEAYTLTEQQRCYDPGDFCVINSPTYTARLFKANPVLLQRVFTSNSCSQWQNNLSLTNTSDPFFMGLGTTTIQTVDNNCANPIATTTAGSTGVFTINTTGSNRIKITRNVNNATPGRAFFDNFVNGYDSYLMSLITTFNFTSNYVNPPFIPTPDQMIAADVNMNDKVRSNDITLQQQRFVWNISDYNQTVSPSVDWRFFPSSMLSTPEFTRSTAYPNPNTSNMAQYWRDNVPDVPLCFPAKAQCAGDQDRIFGVLLGDVGAYYQPANNPNACSLNSYINIPTTAQGTNVATDGVYPSGGNANVRLASTENSSNAYLDLLGAEVNGNNYRIPVILNVDSMPVFSVDLVVDYNQSKVQLNDVEYSSNTSGMVSMAWNDYQDDVLRLTSYIIGDTLSRKGTVYYLSVSKTSGVLRKDDFIDAKILINGIESDVYVNDRTTGLDLKNLSENLVVSMLSVNPSPVNDISEITYQFTGNHASNKIIITDALGQELKSWTSLSKNGVLNINADEFASGMYVCTMYDETSGQTIVKKFTVIK